MNEQAWLDPLYRWVGLPMQATWKLTIVVLSIFYAVGLVGLLLPLHEDFVLLTPFNLLLSLFLVLSHHTDWSVRFVGLLLFTYLAGFFAEVIGVQTGLIFGSYSYGPVLGWKLFETPLMIGVNWILLVYSSAVLVEEWLGRLPGLLKAALAAILMVGLDVLIEPVAMHYDFWQWEGNEIPIQNYIGWLVVAFMIHAVWFTFYTIRKNKVGIALFILQILFFGVLFLAKK